MGTERARRLAAPLALIALGLQATALLLMIPNSRVLSIDALGFNGVGGVVLGITYPALGWLVTSRRPGNAIGWLFLAIGLSQAGTSFVNQYTGLVYLVGVGAPFGELASWLGMFSWVPGFVLLFVAVLLFPDGSLPSRRWRPVVWLFAVAMVLQIVPTAVGAWAYRGPDLASPTFSPDPATDPLIGLAETLANVGQLLVLAAAVAALAGLVVRFRRSGSLERLQIRWFGLAAAIEVALLLLVTSNVVKLAFPFDELAALLVIPLMPIAMATAILRYRLFELDRIISRTVAWTLVTAMIVAVFGIGVVGLQALLAGFTQGQTLAVAGSTLLAFALFAPVRRRVQAAVDRRFDRSRFDGRQAVDAYSERVRDEVDLEALLEDMLLTTHGTVRPRTTAIWLRGAEK